MFKILTMKNKQMWPTKCDLKKDRGVIFHDTDLWFGKWHEEYGKFSPEQFKVSKLG